MTDLQSVPSPVNRGVIRALPGGRRPVHTSTPPAGLDDDEYTAFENLKIAVDGGQVAAMRVVIDDKARVALCIVTRDASGATQMLVVAVLVDDDMFDAMAVPQKDSNS